MAKVYPAWLRKLRAEQDEGLGGTVMKAKSLLGAYAKIRSLFLKRCRDLEAWLVEHSLKIRPGVVAAAPEAGDGLAAGSAADCLAILSQPHALP